MEYVNKIICGDSAVILKEIPDNSIDLVVTSPPYDDLRDYNGFVLDMHTIGEEVYRVLKPGGICAMVIQDSTKNYGKTLTSFKTIIDWCDNIGFKLFECCIYHKNGTEGAWWKNRFRVDHDYDVEAREGYYEEMVRKYGEKLKELAYKEICQSANKNEFPGKVIYDKGFEAGRKITEDQRNEIWESGNDFGYDEGKKDALLELPKWIWEPRMDSNGDDVHDAFIVKRGNHYDDDLYYEGYIINVAQLFNKLRKIGRE